MAPHVTHMDEPEIEEVPTIERVTTPSSDAERLHHGTVEMTDVESGDRDEQLPPHLAEQEKKKGWFTYLKTKEFWIVMLLGQTLSLCLTGTNTFSSLLAAEGTSIPAFQSFFNYVLLNIIYTSYTIYRYGFKKWTRLLWKDGWKYIILAFFDVEGNYFVVLAYRYTTILSAQLIDFWAIVIVVVVSLIFLHVRYHIAQYAGILVCCGGLGVLVASDHITGSNGGPVPEGASEDRRPPPATESRLRPHRRALDALKGDHFCLLGATFYGLSNVYEEFMVSKRPMHEVIGQLAFWGMIINGVQMSIFDRATFATATWNGAVAGFLVGYTLLLTLFYSLAPIVFRMASAALFNIGPLTSDFWGLIVGLRLFGLHVHWMYPIGFVLILVGHLVYYGTEGILGEPKKPWLGEKQEKGDDGLGTARRRIENPGVIIY